MKQLFLSISVIIMVCSCSEKEIKTRQINYENFNKVVTATTLDSVAGSCRFLVFSVIKSNGGAATAEISVNSAGYYCDASSEILAAPNTTDALPLNEDVQVNEQGYWISISRINLNNFAGLGVKYAGYRVADYSTGVLIYYYGWIGIEVDTNMQFINIKDRAIALDAGKPIRTGQIE